MQNVVRRKAFSRTLPVRIRAVVFACHLVLGASAVDAQSSGSLADGAINGQHASDATAERNAPYPTLSELRQSTANLVLTGVLAADSPAAGLAIIGESVESAGTYAVGATLGPGVKLYAVFVDGVVLDQGGTLEALPLLRTPAPVVNLSAPPGITADGPTALADVVRPVPVFANGVQRGYRFYPVSDSQGFAVLGLQPGDLVVSINGTALDDPQRSMATFNSIVSALGATVKVERHGTTFDVTLGGPSTALPHESMGSVSPTQ